MYSLNRSYFYFQAPYQHKLIDLKLLTPEEINWVNTYHSRCREILSPYMNDTEMTWLRQATNPIDVVMTN